MLLGLTRADTLSGVGVPVLADCVSEWGHDFRCAAPGSRAGSGMELFGGVPGSTSLVRNVAWPPVDPIATRLSTLLCRPDYRRLGCVRQSLPGVPLVALTATATPRVRDDIVRNLGMRTGSG